MHIILAPPAKTRPPAAAVSLLTAPTAPTDWSAATAVVPTLAVVAALIIEEATDPATTPPELKPMADTTRGAATAVAAVPTAAPPVKQATERAVVWSHQLLISQGHSNGFQLQLHY